MRTHIKVVGILLIVHSMLLLVPALFFFGASAFMMEAFEEMPPAAYSVAAVFVGLFAVVAVFGIAAGIGILTRARWARIVGIVVAILSLFHFPLGTLVGAYALWVLFHEETKREFEVPATTNAVGTPQV